MLPPTPSVPTRHRDPGTPYATHAARELALSADVWQHALGDMDLGSDMHDGATDLDDLRDGSLPSDDGRRRTTVVHGAGHFLRDGCLDTTHSAAHGPVPSSPTR